MNYCDGEDLQSTDGKNWFVERTCPDHGRYNAVVLLGIGRPFAKSCPGCMEKADCERKERELERQRLAVLEREREEEQRIADLRSHSGIPRRFMEKRFGDYDAVSPGQKRALQICQRYAAKIRDSSKGGESLLLVGKPGTGKTHLATSIGHELVDDGRRVHYAPAAEIVRRVRATYSNSEEEAEEDVFNELNSATLLIIDEVASSQHSEHSLRVLFELVDFRYRECRPMILISNLNVAELRTAVGERLLDRMTEVAITVAFDWKSHRAA